MDRHMPLAAPSAALFVSSDKCAEASYPVMVYCVRITEMGSTKSSQPHPDVAPPNMPLLLMVLANTSEKLAWRVGIRNRPGSTAAAPATCHHTETLLMMASRWLEKMLMIAEIARMITNRMKVRVRL